MTYTKKICLFTALSFVLVNLLTFCFFYIPNFVIMEPIEWVEYTRIFFNRFFEFLLPIVASTVLLVTYQADGMRKTVIRGIFLALPRAVYLLPYYYLYYWIYGNDSIESISLSALVTLFGVALQFGIILLLFWIIRLFARKTMLKELKSGLSLSQQNSPAKNILSKIADKMDERTAFSGLSKPFDLANPYTVGIFAAAFTVFGINLITEIIDTVLYLVEYAGNYYIEEILYITACYIFLLVELIACHVICCFLKNTILKYGANENGID